MAMGTKRSVQLILLSAVFLLGTTLPVAAERMPSRGEGAQATRAGDLARLSRLAARDDVARALAAQGLTTAEVEERLVRLSDDDLRRLAANLDQIQAAGNVPNYIWVLLGILLAVTIITTVF